MGVKPASIQRFPPGRPSPYRIDLRSMKLGDEIKVKIDKMDKRAVRIRRCSYSGSARLFNIKVSCSVLQNPGYITVRRYA